MKSIGIGVALACAIGPMALIVASLAPATQAALDRFVESRMVSTGTPGVAIAVIRGDEVVHLRGYGTADGGAAITPDTPFLLASVSKSFTAVALLQLVQGGEVDLDAPVRDYLLDFRTADAATSAAITVRHLLNHTSGMSDTGFPHMTMPQPTTIAERVASLQTARLTAEPGAQFQYFDPNYAVAARIVEVVSGQPFDEYLRAHVLEPLGMRSTRSVVNTDQLSGVSGLTRGHIVAFGAAIARDEMDGYLAGSTGVISTARDMARYLAFQSGADPDGAAVLEAELLAQSHAPAAGVEGAYGMGWQLVDAGDGSQVLHHNGVLGTYHADVVVVPEERLAIALLYNASHALADYTGAWQGVLAVLRGEEAPGGSVDARWVELGFLVLTVATLLIRLRGLPRIGRPRPAAWRFAARTAWALVPTVVLIGLPSLVAATSGRVFSFAQLLLAMPGPVIWIGVNAAIGLAQIALLAWRRR